MIDKIATVNLDYLKVRNIEQLISWAEAAFSLPAARGEPIEHFTDRLYHHIGKGAIGYTIIEHNSASRSSALEAVIAAPSTGWKTSLVSGLAHDYGLHLTFSDAPRKRRRKWWLW